MLWRRMQDLWRKEGWLLVALAGAVALCLMLGSMDASATQTQEEARLAKVLSAMEGAGAVEVAIYYEAGGSQDVAVPCGAVVVADGAQDVAVRLQLTRAVTTLLGIDGSRVEVFKREGGSTHGRMDP